MAAAEEIVAEELAEFLAWARGLQVQPTVVALRAKTRAVLLAELDRSLGGRLKHLGEGDRAALSQMIESATNKLLHAPTTRLKASAQTGRRARAGAGAEAPLRPARDPGSAAGAHARAVDGGRGRGAERGAEGRRDRGRGREGEPSLKLGVLGALAAIAVAGCAHEAPMDLSTPPPALEGRIYDTAMHAFSTRSAVENKLAAADYVILGEKHDDPHHHLLQAEIVAEIAQLHRHAVVAFEMLDVTEQPAVEHVEQERGDAQAIAQAVEWEKSGWPPFELYRPIFEAALRGHLPIVAANLPRSFVRDLVHGSADPAELSRLGVDRPMPEPFQGALLQELREAHCGHLPEDMLAPMALAQRAKDAEMASRLIESGAGRGAVLICGAGHARSDRGVPKEILKRAPGAKVVSIAFEEVEKGEWDGARFREEPYDYLWFTPTIAREDPCAKMRAGR